MKKIIITFILLFISLILFTACSHEHEFGEWQRTKETTCTQNGLFERYCKCGEKEVRDQEKTGHTPGEWVTALQPSCSYTGRKEKCCTKCNEVLDYIEIDKTEHIPSDSWYILTEETCTTPGESAKRCKNCNITLDTQVIEPHHTEEILPEVASTCKSTGLTQGIKCSKCEIILKEQESTPKKEHIYITIPAIQPTCSKYGYTEGVQCNSCLEWKTPQQQISKLKHTIVTDAKIEPTCTTNGKTEGSHCSVCHTTIVSQNTITKLGHNFSVLTNSCSRCSEKEYPEIKSKNDLQNYDYASYDAVIYLDYCVNVSETNVYWVLTVSPDANYVRLVGTAGVQYNFKFVIDSARTNPIKIDLVNVTIKTLVNEPIIESKSKADIEVGFYGSTCGIIGNDGDNGGDGGKLGGSYNGYAGGNGSVGILTNGNCTITVAATSCRITGGNGGNGGKGGERFGNHGGNGGNGGNGAYAISANSITINVSSGYTQSNLVLSGGHGGSGGAGGEGSGFLYNDGKAGSAGSSSSATNVTVTYI